MFEARYKSVSELIHKSGATQVLELACGYSMRGLDLTRNGLHYVETDLPGVIATKQALLDEVRQHHHLSPSPRHHVAVADALELEQLRGAAGVLDRYRPLVALCEGLMGYLTRTETERVTANLRALLGDFHPGSAWIVPDFAFVAELRNLPPERLRLRAAVTGLTQRQLDASAFEDSDDLVAFFNRIGFATRVASQIDETPSFASLAALGLPAALLDRLRPVLRVWVMTPT